MIALGVQMGGPEQKDIAIDKYLMQAMRLARSSREPDFDNGTEAWINPIFILPGSIWQPDFKGYELAHFSKKKKGLVVKIAVPEKVAKGEDVKEFIVASLREAVRLASAKFGANGISFSTLKAEKIILAIESRL